MAQTKVMSLGGIGAPCCCGGGGTSCSSCSGITIPSTLHVSQVNTCQYPFPTTPFTIFSGVAATYYADVSTIIPHWTYGAFPGWVAIVPGITIGTTCPACLSASNVCSCSATFTLYNLLSCNSAGCNTGTPFTFGQYFLVNGSGCPTDSGTTLGCINSIDVSFTTNQCGPPMSVVAVLSGPEVLYECDTSTTTEFCAGTVTWSP